MAKTKVTRPTKRLDRIDIERVQELRRLQFNQPTSAEGARERMKGELLNGFARAMLVCYGEETLNLRSYRMAFRDVVGLCKLLDGVLAAVDEVPLTRDTGAPMRVVQQLHAARDPVLQSLLKTTEVSHG